MERERGIQREGGVEGEKGLRMHQSLGLENTCLGIKVCVWIRSAVKPRRTYSPKASQMRREKQLQSPTPCVLTDLHHHCPHPLPHCDIRGQKSRLRCTLKPEGKSLESKIRVHFLDT